MIILPVLTKDPVPLTLQRMQSTRAKSRLTRVGQIARIESVYAELNDTMIRQALQNGHYARRAFDDCVRIDVIRRPYVN